MQFENLSPEQQGKVRECKSPAEVLALAKEEGHELTDDELDQISGGFWFHDSVKCPLCGSDQVEPQGMHSYRCSACRQVFTLK